MKVVVPFATRGQAWALQAVRLALAQDGVEASFEHMTDDGSYFRLMSGLWEKGESFAVVEHDIVVWPGGMQELASCPEPWCSMPYYCSVGWIEDGLGCTKFSEEIIRRAPRMFKEPFPDCCAHTSNYCGLDRLIAHRFEQIGIRPHVHSPGVVNLNERWT
jgi:hypothetical protein